MIPILFNTQMVRALKAGRKSETRRLSGLENINTDPDYYGFPEVDGNFVHFKYGAGHKKTVKLRYKKGDILYVKEFFCWIHEDFLIYKADLDPSEYKRYKWKSPYFMKKEYSRFKLKIKNIRIERVNRISDGSIKREGIVASKDDLYYEFEVLWDSINKKKGMGFIVNPWVAVISFEVLAAK
jgi:hypothetical protein